MPNECLHSYPALSVRFTQPSVNTHIAIPDDVNVFFVKAANILGNRAKAEFEEEVHNACIDIQIESPIEQLLFCALTSLVGLGISFGDYYPDDGHEIIIIPQKRINRYRVDFEVQYCRPGKEYCPIRSVLVECDSQTFHDRTEKERRNEKIRDRFLQMSGYKVLLFTGKEITENPFLVAAEVIAFVTGDKTGNVYEWCEIYSHVE